MNRNSEIIKQIIFILRHLIILFKLSSILFFSVSSTLYVLSGEYCSVEVEGLIISVSGGNLKAGQR